DAGEQLVATPDGSPLPDEKLLALEEQHLVQRALGELDERCRRLLTLLFYCDEPPPYAEIAAAVGIREGGVGPTRARCLQKLLRLLNNLGMACIFAALQPTVRCAELINFAVSGVVAV
ncbi:MAG: RNA polymerase sigma factor, partial [Pyrinomonadaceae bacterium]